MTHSAEGVVPVDHPCLPGHFPGNPIVPGVVLVEHALRAIRGGRALRLVAIASLKFLAPVRGGEPFSVHWTWSGLQARFRVSSGTREHCLGLLMFEDDPR